ncbi:hypothetical protein E5J83_24645 [Salmonella enterica subsp. enterica serovar Infantis]|nr:hypothetical protein [Salmonella enterica subsp. enterica serovar Infantis]EBY3845886.1 hypothetical protein [Salmonella enterica subsp. enterica serovar Infantis]EBY3847192.1 hypothetical protein [Salmonella enterica subsp. enterica serovar Infantis]EBZ4632975.1 hypothetical protein [Salmonella enterica subsp. enterica serovar Infantis]EBZ4633354.1 hypothetical protein [Salmonella enterica subsp. enterica serovar Infantis]
MSRSTTTRQLSGVQKDLKQKNLLLKIDFIFLTQVKINLLEVSVRRHWKGSPQNSEKIVR